jgi:hypothetical protein
MRKFLFFFFSLFFLESKPRMKMRMKNKFEICECVCVCVCAGGVSKGFTTTRRVREDRNNSGVFSRRKEFATLLLMSSPENEENY